MSRSAEDRIADIRAAIGRCLRYADDLGATQGHLADMAVDAIERNVTVIGEAANHLPEAVTEALPQIDWPAIRGMRNLLIHEYFGVDKAVVRDVIETELRALDHA
ncbi:MAG TPA: HepT-like ribonuclease domain-containing protein [Candidatus Limnocylindrales bacterium]|nr:HepT-like ribonuclease domain-containing protein [Candidatus Limnocylindrales bacterium]